jgi:hypothetical protein
MSFLKGTSVAGFSGLIVCAVKVTRYVTFHIVLMVFGDIGTW